MFKNIFRGISNFFTSIFGGEDKKPEVQQPDPATVAAQLEAATKDAEEKQRSAAAAQTGRGKLVNPYTNLLGVGTKTDEPFKALF